MLSHGYDHHMRCLPELRTPKGGQESRLHVLASMVGSCADAVRGEELRDLLGLRLEGGVRNHRARLGQCAPGPQQLQQRLLCAAVLCACISTLQLRSVGRAAAISAGPSLRCHPLRLHST